MASVNLKQLLKGILKLVTVPIFLLLDFVLSLGAIATGAVGHLFRLLSRLVIVLPSMLTFLPCSSRASDMIRSKRNVDESG